MPHNMLWFDLILSYFFLLLFEPCDTIFNCVYLYVRIIVNQINWKSFDVYLSMDICFCVCLNSRDDNFLPNLNYNRLKCFFFDG